jgi:hypothetical protein
VVDDRREYPVVDLLDQVWGDFQRQHSMAAL